ncbi:hypothetical protein [Priestia megaterium]
MAALRGAAFYVLKLKNGRLINMPITRTTSEIIGNGTVNTTNIPYAEISVTNGPAIVEYSKGNVNYSKAFYEGTERLIIPAGINTLTVKGGSNTKTKVFLQNSIPEVNLSELKCYRNETGTITITGDDDLVFLSQSVNLATVDISDVRIEMDSLAKLFNRALATKTVGDAARYAKLKAALLAQTKI